jgi:hypothetical protein
VTKSYASSGSTRSPEGGIEMAQKYLLTWNCKHIANAKIIPRIHNALTDLGIPKPIICTPEELLGDDTENE